MDFIDNDGYIVPYKERTIDTTSNASRLINRTFNIISDEELLSIPMGSVWVFDSEVYPNFFYVAFKLVGEEKYVTFERSPACDFNPRKLMYMLWHFCIVGFNSNLYDLYIIQYAINGASTQQIKMLSDDIVVNKIKSRDIKDNYKVERPKINHIDLFELPKGKASLKLYTGRLHCKTMQDLPFKPDHYLEEHEAKVVRVYCVNDLANTELLFNHLAQAIQLRIEMSKQYGVDLRSKSDAQIAEAVIVKEIEKVSSGRVYHPGKDFTVELKYNVPDYLHYDHPELQKLLYDVANASFYLNPKNGEALTPPELKNRIISVGTSSYKFGIGGLHSREKKTAHCASEDVIISDNDVASYYPAIILNQGLYPQHLGENFLDVYREIVDTRLDAKGKAKEAKKQGDKEKAKHYSIIADSLKITINGSFGKFGSQYSKLFSPQLMLQVTLTGQLSLFMLVERLETNGISVVSGNTDGIVSKYHKSQHELVRSIISQWEHETNFVTEETFYKAIYSRDVNSYVAVKDGKRDESAESVSDEINCKTKGDFLGNLKDVDHNPTCIICKDAMLRYLVDGTSIERTITESRDIRRFISIKNVTGGGEKDGVYLGKVVRWYYAKNENGFIRYVKNGHKVGETDGARPLMDLPDEFPQDVDYQWYINKTIDLLKNCGRIQERKTKSFF